ncbi:MAG: hypothetical protein K0S00_2886 [Xanthobacteraceae bacterium]|jgi:hypothetical protein|nr:hypothetical protein [Xanthobacteraceae bacterium]
MSTSVPEIIDSFTRLSTFGRACGFTRHPSQRAYDMRRRGRIPSRYWPLIIENAADASDLDITVEMLLAAHDDRPGVDSTKLPAPLPRIAPRVHEHACEDEVASNKVAHHD